MSKEHLLGDECSELVKAIPEARRAWEAMNMATGDLSTDPSHQKQEVDQVLGLYQRLRNDQAGNTTGEVKHAYKKEKPNGFVIGLPGAGKSTLIEEVFGDTFEGDHTPMKGGGMATTMRIRKYQSSKCPFDLYDCPGIEASASKSQENDRTIAEIKRVFSETNSKKDASEQIHFVWYCIKATQSRFEDCEKSLVRFLLEQTPVIMVITQCCTQEPPTGAIDDFLWQFRDTLPPDLQVRMTIIRVCAKDIFTKDEKIATAFGVDNLATATVKVMPIGQQNAMTRAMSRKRSVSLCKLKAYIAIAGASLTAGAAMMFGKKHEKAKAIERIVSGLFASICYIFGVGKPGKESLITCMAGMFMKGSKMQQLIRESAEDIGSNQASSSAGKALGAGAAVMEVGSQGKHLVKVLAKMIKQGEDLTSENIQARFAAKYG